MSRETTIVGEAVFFRTHNHESTDPIYIFSDHKLQFENAEVIVDNTFTVNGDLTCAGDITGDALISGSYTQVGTTVPGTPAKGHVYYNDTSDTLLYYDGSAWQTIRNTSGSLVAATYTNVGSTAPTTPAAGDIYHDGTANELKVYINGAYYTLDKTIVP